MQKLKVKLNDHTEDLISCKLGYVRVDLVNLLWYDFIYIIDLFDFLKWLLLVDRIEEEEEIL